MKLASAARSALVALLAVGVLAATAAAASAEGVDWAVNKVGLAFGKSVPATVESTTATTVSSPEEKIAFVCKSLKGFGKLTGAEVGTAVFKGKVSKCTVKEQPKCHVEPVGQINGKWHLDWVHASDGLEITIVWGPSKEPPLPGFRVRNCAQEGEYTEEGQIDSNVLSLELPDFTFPEPPLETSALTLRGKPAVWTGSYTLKSTKGALSFVEIP